MSTRNFWKIMAFVAVTTLCASTLAGEGVTPICPAGKMLNKDKTACIDSKAGMNRPSGPNRIQHQPSKPKAALLLPAVQAAREAAREAPKPLQPSGIKPIAPKLGTGSSPQTTAGDTTCNGVESCNDMIATCIALGGNVTQNGYDDDTGAPNAATCYSRNN